MSLILIRRALEKRLDALSPLMPTAWDNVEFDPSANPTGYQRANLLPARTGNPTLSQVRRIESGIFQVMLFYPERTGSAEAEARAQLLREHFPANLMLTEAGIKVRIVGTPSVAAAMPEPGWYAVPVSIRYESIQ
jgi:hypothetical protein